MRPAEHDLPGEPARREPEAEAEIHRANIAKGVMLGPMLAQKQRVTGRPK